MRLQFEITPKENVKLVILKNQLGLSTKKALFLSAMALLKWMVKETKQGRVIASVEPGYEHEGNYKELVMPILDNFPEGRS